MKIKTNPKVSKESLLSAFPNVIEEEMSRQEITPSTLVRKLKEELDYEEPVAVMAKDKKSRKMVVKVINQVSPAAMRVRQVARTDAHKLRNDYPPERKELSGPNGGPLEVDVRPIRVEFVKPKKDSN